VHALYGFARYTDDIVDEVTGVTVADRAARLDSWTDRFWAAMDSTAIDDPVLPAVWDTIERFRLDRQDFIAFFRSMAMDLTLRRYATYRDLLEYMAGSAAAIGTMMLPILAAASNGEPGLSQAALAAAREPARQLGIAFQLTNFIRDVREDLSRGRIYLPLQDLADHGVTPADLSAPVADDAFRSLIAFEVQRARQHYERARVGVLMLPASSQRCIRAAFRIYGGILEEIVRAEYDVLQQRATVPSRRRLVLAVASMMTPAGRPIRTPAS
jgi:phytoene synthase